MNKPAWWNRLSPGSQQEILRFPNDGVVPSIAEELRQLGVVVPSNAHWVGSGPKHHTPDFDDETRAWIREESKRLGFSN